MRARTAVTPSAASASTVIRATARLSSFSVSPPGPTAPGSGPPWPGSMTMSAVLVMLPSAVLTHSRFSQGVSTWAQPPWMASTAMATPARRRPVPGPPGCEATAAPFSPTTKTPEAATRSLGAGPEVVPAPVGRR